MYLNAKADWMFDCCLANMHFPLDSILHLIRSSLFARQKPPPKRQQEQSAR